MIPVAFGRLLKIPGRFLVHGIKGLEIPDNILKILCNLSWYHNVWYVNTKDNKFYDCHINSCGKFNIDVYPQDERVKRQGGLGSSIFTIVVPKQ